MGWPLSTELSNSIMEISGYIVKLEKEQLLKFSFPLKWISMSQKFPGKIEKVKPMGQRLFCWLRTTTRFAILPRAILGRKGYAILEAVNGREALKTLESRNAPVDLLLTDVVMPGMSGRNLYEKIAEKQPDIKVLYMSGVHR